jgi:large subunit ribosomal protein L2
MGKNLIQQKRGKGGPTYLAKSHRYRGAVHNLSLKEGTTAGVVKDLVDCPGHSAPLAEIEFGKETILVVAPEGMRVGDTVQNGDSAEVSLGNTLPLKNIPEGTVVYNVESSPGDGGKFVRSSGTFARVLSHQPDGTVVMLPSKKEKTFQPECRATIGIVAGGGRPEKPFLKAGRKYHAMRAKNLRYPHVCGQSMNAVNHPHGGSRSSKKNTPSSYSVSRHAPPGRKAGMLHPRRTGRKKR